MSLQYIIQYFISQHIICKFKVFSPPKQTHPTQLQLISLLYFNLREKFRTKNFTFFIYQACCISTIIRIFHKCNSHNNKKTAWNFQFNNNFFFLFARVSSSSSSYRASQIVWKKEIKNEGDKTKENGNDRKRVEKKVDKNNFLTIKKRWKEIFISQEKFMKWKWLEKIFSF